MAYQLRTINLRGTNRVTDEGISALAAGCGQLLSINLAYYNEVTDAGFLALVAGCDQLHSINMEGCFHVTDAVILALGHRICPLQAYGIMRWNDT